MRISKALYYIVIWVSLGLFSASEAQKRRGLLKTQWQDYQRDRFLNKVIRLS